MCYPFILRYPSVPRFPLTPWLSIRPWLTSHSMGVRLLNGYHSTYDIHRPMSVHPSILCLSICPYSYLPIPPPAIHCVDIHAPGAIIQPMPPTHPGLSRHPADTPLSVGAYLSYGHPTSLYVSVHRMPSIHPVPWLSIHPRGGQKVEAEDRMPETALPHQGLVLCQADLKTRGPVSRLP